MTQERTEKINAIIQRRKPLADKIQKTRGTIEKIFANFDRLMPTCQATLNNEAIASSFAGLAEIVDSCSRPLSTLRRLSDDLALMQNRFSRNTLNIAVIGRARQGKSKLLQTITGLGATEIPDGDKFFCTGVRSDIINEPNATTAYARVNFLTERQFINDKVAPYFEDLQKFKPELFTPSSVQEFQNLRLPEPGTFKTSSEKPEAEPQMNLHLQHRELPPLIEAGAS